MVQILPDVRKKSFGEKFGGAIQGLGQGLGAAIPQVMQEREELQAGNRQGLDLRGMNQDVRKQAFAESFKQQTEAKKNKLDSFTDELSYGKIKDTFGQKFAELWKAAPVGGKTELLKQGMDAKLRGADLEQMLQGVEIPQENQQNQGMEQGNVNPEAKTPQMQKGKVAKDFKWPDYSKRPSGYTPKEWNDSRKDWRKENSPVFLENKVKLQNNKRDEVAIKKLDKLNKSKKLPEGFDKLILDPETGDIRGLAQLAGLASKEAQEWVKETARFQNRAKDAFGSRVTNFDLQSYMKQFPGLLNSEEGRESIIRMMGINNKLDQLYENALEKVYQKYGLSGIPQEEADKLARSMIEDETEQLNNEYLQLDDQNQMQDQQLSGRMVDVVGPDGQEYEVDEREVEQLPQGFRVL